MHIGIIGINHKLADLLLREAIAKACQRRFSLENPLHDGSIVLLSTCNRTELYFSAEDLVLAHQKILSILKTEVEIDFEQKLYTFFGLDCFLHLAKVTAGLDSAILAETEIQGQVKCAYEAGAALRTLSKDLHFAFQKCLKIGKEVRHGFEKFTSAPDLRHALFKTAKDHFGQTLPPVLFVGASEINLKIAQFLKQKGVKNIAFSNRSEAVFPYLIKEFNASVLPWNQLNDEWEKYEIVICATKCPHYILQNKIEKNGDKLLIDLAVPRNIDPALSSDSIKLLNIDDLQQLLDARKEALTESLEHSEDTIRTQVIRQISSFHAKKTRRCVPMAILA
jgi:glutamyl-tRNA reductase